MGKVPSTVTENIPPQIAIFHIFFDKIFIKKEAGLTYGLTKPGLN
tara:strand:+ start:718 stop:852 length:135 start_codon:yes stop_codon:yes gene_type:complete